MPPQTRSRTRMTNAPMTKAGTTKRGATRKSTSESTSKLPPKKKVRANQSSPDKNTGELIVSQFTDLPVELLVEARLQPVATQIILLTVVYNQVAQYLHPLDLIHLSRANKLLRSMFMRRPAADVWRAALTNSGLPPCPDSAMSEPRYASLIYLEQCSECYRPGNHSIDSILLIRLCCACRKRMALSEKDVGKIARVLNHSEYLVPPWEDKWKRWYLLREYEEMKEKFCKLRESDFNAWNAWEDERAELIKARRERAGPLAKWLKDRDEERRGSFNELQKARVTQVESRLLDLGWKQADICEAENYSGEWTSLVYKAKPLDNKDWKDMLPHLLDGLEEAREVRLKKESRVRAWDREDIVEAWLRLLADQIRPLDLTLRWREPRDGSTTDSKHQPHTPLYPQGIEKQDVTISIPSMPPAHPLTGNCPTQVQELLDGDIPTQEFRLKFQSKQRRLKQYYVDWRRKLEAALVQAIPNQKDLKPVELRNPNFRLVATDDTGDLTGPSNRLSLDLRMLLRADVRFSVEHSWLGSSMHYPDRYWGHWTIGTGGPTYDAVSSRIAQAILRELHLSEASYLEMRALGRPFLCSRCTGDPQYHTWDGIVDHYTSQYQFQAWHSIFRQAKFSHDIDSNEPLVRLVPTQDQTPPSADPQSGCCLM
ncbi:unnamed protein product [Rhizoctonia solani]|uniref:F-box domain-containing protein n=1 Tax=Rhizoctonia solani TaxID=456999 RepID=A0A8H3AA70_9AGAM|nr:unnamed protein product [Rhizoctonia solani]